MKARKPHQLLGFIFITVVISCTHLVAQEGKLELPAELKDKVDALIRKLGNDKYAVREAAQAEIATLLQDTRTFDVLLPYVKRQMDTAQDVEVKVRLERVVKHYLEWGITGYLLKKFPDEMNLVTSGNHEVWKQVATELGNSRDPKTVNLLIRIYIAAARYGELHPLPACSSDVSISCWPAEALVKIGKPAVEQVIRLLDDRESLVRRCAPGVLAKIGDRRVVEPLINALADTNGQVRALSAAALGRLRHRKSVAPLIAALDDQDSRVRRAAARALGNMKETSAVKQLIKMLKDPRVDVRHAAIEALGRIGDRRAAEFLLPFLKDKEVWVRATAAWALGKFRFVKAIEPLIGVLGDKQSDPRAEAVRALGRIGDVRAVEQLIPLLRDGELANLLEEGKERFWWKGSTVRDAASEAILSFGRASLPAVREAFERKGNEDIKDKLAEIIEKITKQ